MGDKNLSVSNVETFHSRWFLLRTGKLITLTSEILNKWGYVFKIEEIMEVYPILKEKTKKSARLEPTRLDFKLFTNSIISL